MTAMTHLSRLELPATVEISPLYISDRLLTLAQQAEQSGYPLAARRLLSLAMTILDDAAGQEPAQQAA
jgi:hypothetical protein